MAVKKKKKNNLAEERHTYLFLAHILEAPRGNSMAELNNPNTTPSGDQHTDSKSSESLEKLPFILGPFSRYMQALFPEILRCLGLEKSLKYNAAKCSKSLLVLAHRHSPRTD